MQISKIWRRHPKKYLKGNHRRKIKIGKFYSWGYKEYL